MLLAIVFADDWLWGKQLTISIRFINSRQIAAFTWIDSVSQPYSVDAW